MTFLSSPFIAKRRFHVSANLSIEQGDAEKLDNVQSDSVDIYAISYGLRNCSNIEKVLQEAYRVIKPGGKFMCLEFSRVEKPIISW